MHFSFCKISRPIKLRHAAIFEAIRGNTRIIVLREGLLLEAFLTEAKHWKVAAVSLVREDRKWQSNSQL